jgi:hypothetical protein
MAFSGDFAKLRQLEQKLRALATTNSSEQRAVLREAGIALKAVIKEQFAKGIQPDGSPQPRLANGRAGLVSRKLPSAVVVELFGTGLRIRPTSSNPHVADILDTQQNGYVFGPRHSKGGHQYRDAKGRITTYRDFVKRASGATRGGEGTGFETYTKDIRGREKKVAERTRVEAHSIGRRVLRPHPIYPSGAVPPRWGRAIADGSGKGLAKVLGLLIEKR